MSEAPKTVADVLKVGADFLEKKDIEQPRLACELLACRLLNCKRMDLYTRHDTALSEKQLEAMRRGIKRVADGEPVQYVTGETGFMDHVFKTDKRALIPRPETEVLVKQVLECEELWKNRPAIIDVGTGSGCIIISLAAKYPEANYIGMDVSSDAVSLAKENAEKCGVSDRIAFASKDISDTIEPESIDALIANLPYIPSDVCDKLPRHIIEHEPRAALDGGPDGLDIIRSVVSDAAIVLKPGGFIFLEAGEDQADKVKEILAGEGFADVSVTKDLNGKDRIISARING